MYEKIQKSKITRMEIVKTDCKMTLRQVVAKYEPKYAINGGLYDMNTGKVCDIPLRIDGRTVATSSDGYWMMAWNEGPDICMIHSRDMAKWRYAIACSAMLKDGANTIFKYNADQGGVRGRTGFGDDDDSVHLLVTTDVNGPMKPESLRAKMKGEYCRNAIMLDCGGSSQGYFDGKYINYGSRKVSYWILIWTDEVVCPYKEPTTNVRYGTRGTTAKWVQWQLNRIGYDCGTVDGVFGKKSTDALKAFQKAMWPNDEKQWDGVCGKLTRQKLKEE